MKTGDSVSLSPRRVKMAGPTRFELATSGVTGRRSNQLNYDPAFRINNLQPPSKHCQPNLPAVSMGTCLFYTFHEPQSARRRVRVRRRRLTNVPQPLDRRPVLR